jgi:diaminopimelate epimerase
MTSVHTLQFAKYQGAGNDFLVIDGRLPDLARVNWPALARAICDRHFGAGADGLLIAAPPQTAASGHRMRMYNPDGSEAEMCGNGLRCFVRWLRDRGETSGAALRIDTGAGTLLARLHEDGQVSAGMGAPRLAPHQIPLSAEAAAGQPLGGPVLRLMVDVARDIPLPASPGFPPAGQNERKAQRVALTCVSMGNPHAVLFVQDVDVVRLDALGPYLEAHPYFPARTNVELCQIVSPRRLRVRVWERGAGLTLACGTGACAAAVAARLHGKAADAVAVEMPGGELQVTWAGQHAVATDDGPTGLDEVTLRGPAVHVFDAIWTSPIPLQAAEPAGVLD